MARDIVIDTHGEFLNSVLVFQVPVYLPIPHNSLSANQEVGYNADAIIGKKSSTSKLRKQGKDPLVYVLPTP